MKLYTKRFIFFFLAFMFGNIALSGIESQFSKFDHFFSYFEYNFA